MNRRSFLCTAGFAMVVLPQFAFSLPVRRQPVFLASRTVAPNFTKVAFRLGRADITRPLVMKVSGSGLWIDAVELDFGSAEKVSIPMARRLIPGHAIELQSCGSCGAPLRHAVVHYAHLPFDRSRTTLGLWTA